MYRSRRRPPFLAALAAALLVPACFSVAGRREEVLVRNAHEFNDNLRWARYEHVVEFLPRAEARLFLARAADIGEDLAMADAEVTSVDFAAGSEKATVVVQFVWYSRRNLIEKKTTLEQQWEYQRNRWTVVKQRRIRGDRLALVPEPMAPPSDGGAPDAAAS